MTLKPLSMMQGRSWWPPLLILFHLYNKNLVDNGYITNTSIIISELI